MKIITHEQLIADIDQFLKRNNMKSYDFGKKYLNDSGAISRLKRGVDPRLSTVRKIYQIIGDN